MHRYMGYTEVHWKLLLTAQAGAPNASFSGGCHCHVKVQNRGVQPAWVQHSAPTLLLPGLCWRGQGRGLRTRSLTCLIPVLKGLWIQGCCLCKRWRGHRAWPFVWGKPSQDSCPPTLQGGTAFPGGSWTSVLGDPLSSSSSSSCRHHVSGPGMHIGLGRGHLFPIVSQRSSSWQRDVQQGTDRWTGIRELQRPATWLCPECSLPCGVEGGTWVCWWPDKG